MNTLHPAAIGFAVRRALAEVGLAARLLVRLLFSQNGGSSACQVTRIQAHA